MARDRHYTNIRSILGGLIGQRVLDITQHDSEEWNETGVSYFELMFENGDTLRIPVGDEGFDYHSESGETA